MSKYKEKRRARIIFKCLKAGIAKPEELKLLRKYYPFLFH